jgi:transposase
MSDTGDQWRMADELWARIAPLVPPGQLHPLGCHNPRVPTRQAMAASFFVLRTGGQWNALNATGICSSRAAHRRLQEWVAAGVCHRLWAQGLAAYDDLPGLDWAWLALDGAMTTAPRGGGKPGPNPTDRGKRGTKRRLLTEAAGVPIGLVVAGANRNDCKRTRATLESRPIPRPTPTPAAPQGRCLDKG